MANIVSTLSGARSPAWGRAPARESVTWERIRGALGLTAWQVGAPMAGVSLAPGAWAVRIGVDPGTPPGSLHTDAVASPGVVLVADLGELRGPASSSLGAGRGGSLLSRRLVVAGRVVGAVHLIARRPGAFDAAAVEALERLAGWMMLELEAAEGGGSAGPGAVSSGGRAIGEDLPDVGMFQVEMTGRGPRVSSATRSLLEILGLSRQQIEDDPSYLLERVEPAGLARISGRLARAGLGEPVEGELTVATPTGERLLHLLCVSRWRDNGCVCWDGIVVDRTGRRPGDRENPSREQDPTVQDSLVVQACRLAGLGAWEYDLRAGRFEADREFHQMHGTGGDPAHALLEIARRVSPTELEDCATQFGALIGGGGAVEREIEFADDDGWRRFFVRAEVVRSAEGVPVAIRGFSQEVTDQRRLERVLRQSESRLRRFLETAGEAVVGCDRNGRVNFVNPRLPELLARPEDELLGMHVESFLDPASVPVARAAFERVLRGERQRYQVHLRTTSGGRVTALVTSSPLVENGRTVGVFSTLADLTDLRRMEEERERLAHILDATPDLVSIADAQGAVVYLNNAARRFLGVAPDTDLRVLGLSVTARHAAWAARFVEGVGLPTAARDGVWVGEVALCTHAGMEVPVSQTILAHRAPDGTIDYYSLLARDIRAQKSTESALAAARLRAEAANRSKSAFLANMSHELRTPLNAVIGFSEILAQKTFGPLNARQAEYLDHVVAGGRHLLALVNDILDLSMVEAGRITLDVADTSLVDLVESVCATMRPTAVRAGLELEVVPSANLPTIRADEQRIRQILLNLLSNACKFTPPGGRVQVEAKHDEHEVVVSVQDTGVGIAEEDRDRVFEEFERVEVPGLPRADATGLGLPLSRRLAEMHGGRIDLESELGKGSTFRLRLPLGRAAGPRPRVVLFVGDDPVSAGLVHAWLEEIGVAPTVVNRADTVRLLLSRTATRALIVEQSAATVARRALAGAAGEVPVLFVGDEAMNVPGKATRAALVEFLRGAGIPLPLLAGVRLWLCDPRDELAELEHRLQELGARIRRGSTLSGAVACDADVILMVSPSEPDLSQPHGSIPTCFVNEVPTLDLLAQRVLSLSTPTTSTPRE